MSVALDVNYWTPLWHAILTAALAGTTCWLILRRHTR